MGIRDYVYVWNDKLKRTITDNPEQSAMIPGMSYVERYGLFDNQSKGKVQCSTTGRFGEFLLDEERGGLSQDNSLRKSFEFAYNPKLGNAQVYIAAAGFSATMGAFVLDPLNKWILPIGLFSVVGVTGFTLLRGVKQAVIVADGEREFKKKKREQTELEALAWGGPQKMKFKTKNNLESLAKEEESA